MTAFGVLFALTLMLPVGVQDSSPSPSYDGPRLILMARLSDGIEAVTITDSSGITDVDTSIEWNPDKEPINQVRVALF